MVNKVNQRHI